MQSRLRILAQEMNCELLSGDTSDIIAFPFFIAVVDRNQVGLKWWNTFLEYRLETSDYLPCIVIDDIDKQDIVTRKKIFYSDDADKISRLIQREKKKLTRFNIYYTNPYIQRVKMEIAIFWADFR